MTIRPIVLSLVLLAAAAAARADIAPDPLGRGVTPHPRSGATDVAMTAEEVELGLTKDRLDVKVTFHLENQGAEATLEVGFPTNYKDELEKFTVEIDGKSTPPSLKEQVSSWGRGKKSYSYWHVWDMSFAPGAKKTVIVTYTVKPNSRGFGVRGMWSSEWEDIVGGEEAEKSLARLNTGYILETGAPWKGSIGKAVVHLALQDGLTAENIREVAPAPTSKTATSLDWTFTDLEPTENIGITYTPGATIDTELALMRKCIARKMSFENALRFREHIADLVAMKGDAAALRAAWDDVLDLVVRAQTAKMTCDYQAADALVEAVDALLVTPEALADPASAARAKKAGDFLDLWIPFLRESNHYNAKEVLTTARVTQLKVSKALGRDAQGLVQTLSVPWSYGRTMVIAPEDSGRLAIDTERVAIKVGDKTTRYEAVYQLRGLQDGNVDVSIWNPLSDSDAALVTAADGKFDNFEVLLGDKPVHVGCVVRNVKEDGEKTPRKVTFVGWTLPVKAGTALEVTVRFALPNLAPRSGFVWLPSQKGPRDDEPRFHRHIAYWNVSGECWTGPRKVSITLELPKDVTPAHIRHVIPLTGKTDGSTIRWTLDAVDTSKPGGEVDAWVQWKGFTLEEEIAWLQKLLEPKPTWADLASLQLALAYHTAGRYEDEIAIWEGFITTKAQPLSIGGGGSESLEPGMYRSRPYECAILDARRAMKDEKATRAAAERAVTALKGAIEKCRGPQGEEIALWKEMAECQRLIGNEKEAVEAEKKAKEIEDKYK